MKMTAKPLFALAALAMFTSATVAYAQSGGSGAMTKQDAPAAAAPAAGSGSMTNSAATDAPKMPAGATTSAGSGAMNATTETTETTGAGSGAMNKAVETTTNAGSGTMTNATVKKDGAMEQTMSKDAMPKPAAAPRGSN